MASATAPAVVSESAEVEAEMEQTVKKQRKLPDTFKQRTLLEPVPTSSASSSLAADAMLLVVVNRQAALEHVISKVDDRVVQLQGQFNSMPPFNDQIAQLVSWARSMDQDRKTKQNYVVLFCFSLFQDLDNQQDAIQRSDTAHTRIANDHLKQLREGKAALQDCQQALDVHRDQINETADKVHINQQELQVCRNQQAISRDVMAGILDRLTELESANNAVRQENACLKVRLLEMERESIDLKEFRINQKYTHLKLLELQEITGGAVCPPEWENLYPLGNMEHRIFSVSPPPDHPAYQLWRCRHLMYKLHAENRWVDFSNDFM